MPSSTIAAGLDGIIGIKEGVQFIFNGASDIEGWQFVGLRLYSLETCLGCAFRHSISVLNIYSRFYRKASIDDHRWAALHYGEIVEPSVSMEGHGILTDYFVHNILKDHARSFSHNGNIVAAKLIYFIMAPSAVVTRIADLAIGVIVSIGAVCTLGRQPSVNHLAFRGLQITGIVNDLFYCCAKLVNSQAGRV